MTTVDSGNLTRGRRGLAGFTLLEVIVAMMLASIATLLGAIVLKNGMDYLQRSRDYVREQDEIRSLTRAIDSAWSLRVSHGFVADESSVQFSVRRPVRGPGYEWVRLVRFACVRGNDGRLMLVEEYYDHPERTTRGPGDLGDPVFLADEVLSDNLDECRFAYLEANEEKKTARWVDVWSPEIAMAPRLLRLHVSVRRGVLPPLVFTTG